MVLLYSTKRVAPGSTIASCTILETALSQQPPPPAEVVCNDNVSKPLHTRRASLPVSTVACLDDFLGFLDQSPETKQ